MGLDDNSIIFSNNNIKNTRQRNLVLNELNSTKNPVTAEQIFLKVKQFENSISMSTVYRILDLFVEKSLVIKRHINVDNRLVFEMNRMEHKHYLICNSCKKFIKLDTCPLRSYEKLLESKTGFEITSHKLDIYGKCLDCIQGKV